MKKLLLLITLLLSVLTFAQNQGITYQAVLYNTKGESLPGINNPTSPITNKLVCLQFSIIDSNSQTEYQEKATVTTYAFGMVNLVIGNGTQTGGYASSFAAIVWSNGQKKLKVSLDQTGNSTVFEEISNQLLTYVPYALNANSATNVSGVIGIANGGTNATTVLGAKTNLQLQNVDNTSDLNKPVSTATQTALNAKVDKITGKGLSTEDFTTAEKTKLASLSNVDLTNYVTLTNLATKVDKVDGKGLSTEDFTTAEKTKLASLSTASGVPYTGAIGPVNLGNYDLKVNGLTIGKGTGQNDQNTAIGAGALNSSGANGTRNTAVGYLALKDYRGTSFDNNTGVGYFNMIGLTTGYGNTSIGAETMFNVGSASNNTGIGNQSLINASGDNNVGVGARSGDGLTTGSNNTFIGTQARTTSATSTISNATAIGSEAIVTTSNTIQLGNSSVTDVKTNGVITSSGFKTPTGTSSQYLMADGSVSTSAGGSSNGSFVDLLTNQTIAGNKNFTGTIGIGTSSNYANSKLHIAGNGLVVWGGTGTLLDASGNSHGYNENVALTVDGKAGSDILQLRDSSPNTLLVVDSDGKMGIGNTSPSEKLEVTGNIKSSGDITASGFKTPTGTSSQYLMADGSVSTSGGGSNGSFVDLSTDQTIAGVKTFSPVLNATADNQSLIGLNIDPQFNDGGFNGVNKTALKLKGDLTFAEGSNYLKFANGSMLGDVYNIGTDPSGTVDLYVPEGASWLELNYGNRNYFWMDNASAYLSTGSIGKSYFWKFDGDNGVTELPGSIRAGGITYPATDGSAGQVLSTDGSGNLSWTTPVSGSIQGGSSGQVLSTDGSGNLSWITPPTTDISNLVDLTSDQTIGGNKVFNGKIVVNDEIKIGTPGFGDANIMFGKGSFQGAQYNGTGNHNTAIGTMTLAEARGGNNTAIGSNAMRQGQSNGNGSSNTAVGARALTNATDSNYNVAVGFNTLENAFGDKNTGIGSAALQGNTTGANNVGLGFRSGATNETGSDNIFIGLEADAASNNLSNATAIGKGAIVDASNTIQLGNSAITDVKTTGTITGNGFKTPTGTSSQYLMADGSVSSGGNNTHYVGEAYGGGIVFFTYDNGAHGLIVATSEIGDLGPESSASTTGITFGGTGIWTGAYRYGIGGGLENTNVIISKNSNTGTQYFHYSGTTNTLYAALSASQYLPSGVTQYYGDWYLPSKGELELLWNNRSSITGSGYNSAHEYWSSTETNENYAYKLATNGGVGWTPKASLCFVLPIRRF